MRGRAHYPVILARKAPGFPCLHFAECAPASHGGIASFDCCVLSSRGRVLFPKLFTEESVDPLQLVSALVGIGKNAVMLSRLIVVDFDGLACRP